MLKISGLNEANQTIEILVDGKITREDLLNVYSMIEEKEKEWGKVNLLERYLGMTGIEPLAIWYDLKLYFQHKKYFNKAALVTDKRWIERLTHVLGPLFKIDVKVFSLDKISDARHWLAS